MNTDIVNLFTQESEKLGKKLGKELTTSDGVVFYGVISQAMSLVGDYAQKSEVIFTLATTTPNLTGKVFPNAGKNWEIGQIIDGDGFFYTYHLGVKK
jgi:hypothetical protein